MKYVDQVIYGFLFGTGFLVVNAIAERFFSAGIN